MATKFKIKCDTYWKIINLRFQQQKKHRNYLTAIWVSCHTWVRHTSGNSGWKLSQDDSSLLEQQDVDGEQKTRGDRNPIPKGESVGKKKIFLLYLTYFKLFNDLCNPLYGVQNTIIRISSEVHTVT